MSTPPALRAVHLRGGDVEISVLAAPPGRGGLPALVFLHEGLGSIGLWRGFPAALARRTGRTAVVWSRHGYGGSAPIRAPRTVDYMHGEALEVLPELLDLLAETDGGCVSPVLVGHSDGASIALIHAGSSGRATAGVVALAPHVLVEERSVAGIEAAGVAFRTTDLAARLGRHHRDPAATFWGWNDIWLSPGFRSWNIEECLSGIDVPVLGVQCADDEYGSLDQLARIRAGVRGPYEEIILPTGGHSPHLADPPTVVEGIGAFLDRHAALRLTHDPRPSPAPTPACPYPGVSRT